MKDYLILALIVGLLVLNVYQAFQTNAVMAAVKEMSFGVSGIDTSGWTEDEKMMYEHHGVMPARLQSAQGSLSSSGMVGGC